MNSRQLGVVFLVLGALLSVTLLFSQQGRRPKTFVAPDFSVVTLDGESLNLQQFRGSIVLVNFWATWCPPCREELPSLERLYRKLRPQGLSLVAISVDERPEPVRALLRTYEVSFPVALDRDARIPSLYGVTGYPETFVVDSTGTVIRHFIGPQEWDSEPILRFFEDLLRRAGASSAAR